MNNIIITEVCPRDGFQNIKELISKEVKVNVINQILDCGYNELEVTSFVHPKAIPQLSDAEEVLKDINRVKDLKLKVLVPNLKGLERAIQANVDCVKFMLSATDSHSLSNSNCTTEEAMEKFRPMVKRVAQLQNKSLRIVGSISVAFGCLFEGKVPIERLITICDKYERLGINEISLADTNGVANPMQVKEVIRELKQRFSNFKFSLHLHNARGMAFANAVAGLEEGVTKFDSSVGGLGGCPYTPKASGNIASEDLIHGFEEMGIDTGVNLDKVLNVAKYLNELFPTQTDSFLLKAGKPSDLYKLPKKQEKVSDS